MYVNLRRTGQVASWAPGAADCKLVAGRGSAKNMGSTLLRTWGPSVMLKSPKNGSDPEKEKSVTHCISLEERRTSRGFSARQRHGVAPVTWSNWQTKGGIPNGPT